MADGIGYAPPGSCACEWIKESRFPGYWALFSDCWDNCDCGLWLDYDIGGTHEISVELWVRYPWDFVSSCGAPAFAAQDPWGDVTCPWSQKRFLAWAVGPCKAALCGNDGGFFGMARTETTAALGRFINPEVTEEAKDEWRRKWHHLVMTYDGSGLCFYLDGELRDTEPCTGDIVTGPTEGGEWDQRYKVYIGRGAVSVVVDEAILFNRVMDAWEVANHYNMGRPEGYPAANYAY